MTVPLPLGVTGLPVDMMRADRSTYSARTMTSGPALLTQTNLTDAEATLVANLHSRVLADRFRLELHGSYYAGTHRLTDLGISIPPQMRVLRTALGWPRVCVEALDERINLEGFRFPTSPDVDADLQSVCQANDLFAESQLAQMDALVYGRAYVAVGSAQPGPFSTTDCPLVTVESPLDFAAVWDPRLRRATSALRLIGGDGGPPAATLYGPDQTVSLELGRGGWVVVDRDQHRLGVCPVVRLANRPRSYDRDGTSEITPEIMSITDAACRTLQGLEVAREFYSAPQRYILGADESAFQDAAGNPKSAWETYIGRVLALERDADGNLPTVGQFTPYDPSTFTKVIDMYAKIISSITGLPPHVLGYTTDNPASADAIRSSEMRLTLKADRKTRMFGSGWADVMRLVLLIRDGVLPAGAESLTAVWASTATPTPAATTDAVVKQITSGYLPATSDVTGEKLGYTALERQRIEVDRATDAGASFLQEIAHSLTAKAAKVDKGLSGDLAHPAGAAGPAVAAAGPAPAAPMEPMGPAGAVGG